MPRYYRPTMRDHDAALQALAKHKAGPPVLSEMHVDALALLAACAAAVEPIDRDSLELARTALRQMARHE